MLSLSKKGKKREKTQKKDKTRSVAVTRGCPRTERNVLLAQVLGVLLFLFVWVRAEEVHSRAA